MVKPSYDKLRKRKHIIVHHLNLSTLRGSFADFRPCKLDLMKKSRRAFVNIYFWVGVNIIGLPEIVRHRLWAETPKYYNKFYK